jgi:hypothetical protein
VKTILSTFCLVLLLVSAVQAADSINFRSIGSDSALSDGVALAQETATPSSATFDSDNLSLLARASLGRLSVGFVDAELNVLRLGLGIGWHKFGIVASTGLAQVAPGGEGDYMLQITVVPVECDITYGLAPGRRLGQPVFYVHGEYNPISLAYQLHGGGVSIGALWTFWAVSGGVQVGWRRTVFGEDPTGRTHRDYFSAGVTFDLGGWWAVGIQSTRRHSGTL